VEKIMEYFGDLEELEERDQLQLEGSNTWKVIQCNLNSALSPQDEDNYIRYFALASG
jgi:hypothetical protein